MTVYLMLFSPKQCKKNDRFSFCEILNNQGLGKCYQPRSLAQLITLTLTLIVPDITKTSFNNCLLLTGNACPGGKGEP